MKTITQKDLDTFWDSLQGDSVAIERAYRQLIKLNKRFVLGNLKLIVLLENGYLESMAKSKQLLASSADQGEAPLSIEFEKCMQRTLEAQKRFDADGLTPELEEEIGHIKKWREELEEKFDRVRHSHEDHMAEFKNASLDTHRMLKTVASKSGELYEKNKRYLRNLKRSKVVVRSILYLLFFLIFYSTDILSDRLEKLPYLKDMPFLLVLLLLFLISVVIVEPIQARITTYIHLRNLRIQTQKLKEQYADYIKAMDRLSGHMHLTRQGLLDLLNDLI